MKETGRLLTVQRYHHVGHRNCRPVPRRMRSLSAPDSSFDESTETLYRCNISVESLGKLWSFAGCASLGFVR